MPPVTAPPRRRRPRPSSSSTSPDLGVDSGEKRVAIRRGRLMKRHRAIGRAVDALANVQVGRRADLLGGAAGDDLSLGNEIQVIDDLEGFVYVVRHDHRGDAQRVVQTSYKLA